MRGQAGGDARMKPEGQKVGRSGSRGSARARVVTIGKAKGQPDLPERAGGWPEPTLIWYEHWGASALSNDFTNSDWDALLETARYHALIWDERAPMTAMLKAGAEVRQRMALFGATPLDRQRLRIQLVFADEAEAKADAAGTTAPASSRRRRGPLKAEAG